MEKAYAMSVAANRLAGGATQSSAEALLVRVGELRVDGHAHAIALSTATGPDAARDLADFVHLLCSLHGSHPGFLGLAFRTCADDPMRKWLSDAALAFERERIYLVRLSAAAGPIPSTPGAAESESALNAQRNALDTLARSERRGCAMGASAIFVDEWRSLRPLLDKAALRIGLDQPQTTLPDQPAIFEALEMASDTPASSRAVGFGAEQLLLQHRSLFDLLEARASARRDM